MRTPPALIFFVVVSSLLSSTSGAHDNEQLFCNPVTSLKGDELQALATALADFSAVLRQRAKKGKRLTLRDHRVHVCKYDHKVVVDFAPDDEKSVGGDTEYMLDPPYLKIARRRFMK
jgi:hypothetical protein